MGSVRLGWKLKGMNPATVALPTTDARDRNGAVLRPTTGFDAVVAQFQ
jgi:hypothetical protein